jgi:hypothetical protein
METDWHTPVPPRSPKPASDSRMSASSARKLNATLALAAFVIWSAGSILNAQDQKPPADRGAVAAEMRNVMYHFTDEFGVHIVRLQGMLVPQKEGSLPIFDDPKSFTLDIRSAEISMRVDALSNVLNQYVFAANDSPIKDVAITIQGSLLKLKGKLHSKGDVPFETEGTVGPAPDGQILVRAQKIKAIKLPVKGLMDLLGLKLADLISTRKIAGVRLDGDDLILDPQLILPPPHIQGKVTGVRLASGEIVLVFGEESRPQKAHVNGNYMAYRGAQLRFGKLTMADTDLILIDMDPKDPFDFYLDHYKQQLAAGYTKETLDFGLRVYMPDYNKLQKPSAKKTGVGTPQANPRKARQP